MLAHKEGFLIAKATSVLSCHLLILSEVRFFPVPTELHICSQLYHFLNVILFQGVAYNRRQFSVVFIQLK